MNGRASGIEDFEPVVAASRIFFDVFIAKPVKAASMYLVGFSNRCAVTVVKSVSI